MVGITPFRACGAEARFGANERFYATINGRSSTINMNHTKEAKGPPSGVSPVLSNHEHSYPNAGVKYVEQEVLAIDVVNVAVVVKTPLGWPRIDQLERVATENYDRLGDVHDLSALHVERVLPSEVAPKLIIWNVFALLPRGMLVLISSDILTGAAIIFGCPRSLILPLVSLLLLLRTISLGPVLALVAAAGIRGFVAFSLIWSGGFFRPGFVIVPRLVVIFCLLVFLGLAGFVFLRIAPSGREQEEK